MVASQVRSDDPIQDEEDLCAVAAAISSCCSARTPAGWPATGARPRCCVTPEGREAVGVPDGERVLGLIHLGPPRQEKEPPERLPTGEFVTFLP